MQRAYYSSSKNSAISSTLDKDIPLFCNLWKEKNPKNFILDP